MERKRKNPKISSATDQEIESNDLRRKQQTGSNLALATRDDSPLCDTMTSLNRQYHSFPQNVVEQPFSSSKPHVPTQSQLPVDISQRERKLNLQLLQYHAQQGNLPGYLLPGVNAPGVPQPFTPIGTIDRTSLSNHPQFFNLGYQFVYPNPGFPGYCDPSPWRQVFPPCTYIAPGAYGYISSQHPNMVDSATSLLQSFEKGTPGKLSQKHQQLWDALSAENVQLQSVIFQLQSQITDYYSRILNLEAEIPLAKQAVEDPTAHVVGTAVSRKRSERGRPKKSAASVDTPPSPDKSPVQAQARKPNLDIISNDCLDEDPNFALKVLSQEAEKIDNKGYLATCAGEMNRNLAWPYTISNNSGKNVQNLSSENFYDKDNVIQGGEKFIPGYSWMDEEDAFKELVEGLIALSKGKIEQEMRDVAYERGGGSPHFGHS